ncbi:endonuclease domain-containing protein [Cellulosimicrobium cellulans]|uniref:endonuclease domain-containing protein n=1 Tax=Cellulosimicrobium cellulans TaxID=1710 RepID=UPI002404DB68|nr:DUF559 domain-containing protein [Cellulosimicrobium cellulans]MDF9878006.1 hypothetical protein [Cellulosimicrobium cellulans]
MDTPPRPPFTLAEGRAAGLSDKAMRHPRFATPTSGVRVPMELADDLVSRCGAMLRVAPDRSAISHATALALHGVDLPGRLAADGRIHLTVPSSTVVPRRAGLASHTFADASDQPGLPIRVVRGVPAVAPEHAWRQLAGSSSVEELVVLGDAIVRRRRPPTTVAALRRAVHGAPAGTRGIARLRGALDLVRPGTDSPMESRTRLLLVSAGLSCPLVNLPVHDTAGVFVAMPDMTYPEARIAIEYDGDVHRTDPRTWRRDIARKQRLEELGWRVIVVTADDVYLHPAQLVTRVRAALRRPQPAEK